MEEIREFLRAFTEIPIDLGTIIAFVVGFVARGYVHIIK